VQQPGATDLDTVLTQCNAAFPQKGLGAVVKRILQVIDYFADTAVDDHLRAK